ncbi:hypothetical protein [Pedobacter sp. GR22-10]|uniref:hypothetical protein n=1 Tax=Pedobacter sp. GR22-10 TaxID=2994472 RepID=UPI00224561EC|nr:hypothetical protein [Pedobacter sp. GR22-10]MCX2432178.1 hypothetical protein [Pedobacter sp. GR22-10]
MYTKSFNTKKTWLGAMFSFALVAIMGLAFAFKPSNSSANTKKVQPNLYWYQISSSGTLQAQLNSTPQTKDDSMPGGSNPLTSCEDQTAADCIRGYETVQTIDDVAPAPADNDHRVRFSN